MKVKDILKIIHSYTKHNQEYIQDYLKSNLNNTENHLNYIGDKPISSEELMRGYPEQIYY